MIEDERNKESEGSSNKAYKKGYLERLSTSKNADWWLGMVSFVEASFFPIPPSTLMIHMMSLGERHKKWLYYGALTTATSVLGGVFGYLIGSVFYDFLGEFIIEAYDLQSEIQRVGEMFRDNAFFAIFMAAFTPIPYKVFTIAGGFFKVDLLVFVAASILGRGIRFFAVAGFVHFLGRKVGGKAMKYLNYFALIIALLAIGYFLVKIFSFIWG